MTNLFIQALKKKNEFRPPVWFMRQAGRYHRHYQALRKTASFVDLCKVPQLAATTAMGPIDEFGFDAAILFSDLLFPLEVMGFGLTYEEGPKLSFHLEKKEDLDRLKSGARLAQALSFQSEALGLIRQRLSREKGLIGFVGGFFTLFCYAVLGSHQKPLRDKDHFEKVRSSCFDGFCEKLFDILLENMVDQGKNCDCLAVMDTALGDVHMDIFTSQVFPWFVQLFSAYHKRCETPLLLYSKNTHPAHLRKFAHLEMEGIGVDWKHSICDILDEFSERFVIQGNFDPHLLEKQDCQEDIEEFFAPILSLPRAKLSGWVCGLGHGVLKTTPELNVKKFLEYQKKCFGDA